jgi:hypothetical protein
LGDEPTQLRRLADEKKSPVPESSRREGKGYRNLEKG